MMKTVRMNTLVTAIVVGGMLIGSPALAAAPDDGNTLRLSGVALIGGGVLLEVLSFTSLKQSKVLQLGDTFHHDYVYSDRFYDYYNDYYTHNFVTVTNTNRPVMAAGIALAGVGTVLWYLGANKKVKKLPTVTVGKRLTVSQTFAF